MDKKTNKKKTPYIAALLNFLTLGGGYLYIGKRKTLGIFLVISAAIMFVELLVGSHNLAEHFVSRQNIADTHSLSITLIAAALAYDAYVLTKR